MKPIIDLEGTVSFKFKICKTTESSILIGIVDKSMIKETSSYNSGKAVCYYGSGGYKFPGRTKEGKGFVQGDIVETVINLSEGIVQWKVNNHEVGSYGEHFLRNPRSEFVPYIEMASKGDTI